MNQSLFFFSLIFSLSAFAIQDLQVDVVDQNFNSSNKIVITAEQIKKSHATTLTQILSGEANISVASTSFQPNSIYLRGGDSSHVLILIDGVPTYDPSTVQRTINLSNLNLKNIQKIEIIKGSQSVLYGGQAMSGVISIHTFPEKADHKSDLQTTIELATGPSSPFNFYENKLKLEYKKLEYKKQETALFGLNLLNTYVPHPAFTISTALNSKYVQASSPVLDSSKTYPQKLGSADTTIQYKNSEIQNTLLRLNYSDDRSQIATTDSISFKAADAENFAANTESYGLALTHKIKDLFQISFSHQSTRRLFLQNELDGLGSATDQDYRGRLYVARCDFQPVNTSTHQLFVGYSYDQEEMKSLNANVTESDHQNQNEGLYLKSETYFTPQLLFEIGARHQMSKLQAVDNTYQIGFTYDKQWKVEHSTGLKNPSLFQLYSSYGNSNLQPEKAKNSSLSFENKISEQIFFSATVFDAQFENLIAIRGSPATYKNISATRTVGAEVMTSIRFVDLATNINLSLGYQEPKDLSLNSWLVRRPLRTASFKISKNFFEKLDLSAELNHTGSRRDRGAGVSYHTISDYTLLNVVANYTFGEDLSAFIRSDNATDQKYQTAYGFYTQGILSKAGLEFSF